MLGWKHSNPDNAIRLHANNFWRVNSGRRGKRIACLNGMLWVTQEGDLKDHILTAGEEFVAAQDGLVLVEAVRDASVLVTSPEKHGVVSRHGPNSREPKRLAEVSARP